MSRVAMKRDALAFANELLALQGAEPVTSLSKGIDHDTFGCPIARTATVEGSGIKWCVGPFAAAFRGGRELKRMRRETPAGALAFTAAFDAGVFPRLMETTTEAVTA